MDPDQDDQQQRSKRIRKRFVLRAALYGEEPLKWSYCTIHNLSATGILFTFDRHAAIGAHLYLKIDFPDKLIECVGQVARKANRQNGEIQDVGIHFVRIRPEDKAYIEAFVERYKEK